MSAPKETGWMQASLAGHQTGEPDEINFSRTDEPGALVAVELADKTIHVRPASLLAAAQLMQIGEEN